MILQELSREEEQESLINSRDKDIDLLGQTNLSSQIKILSPIYLAMSLIVLSAAILSQFQYARAQTFPLFMELPFQKNQLFTIGNALISLIGIIIYYLVFQANQNKNLKKRFYELSKNLLITYNFSHYVCICGILGHLSFLAFALLPIDYKNQSNFIYTEDRILLTFSFIMNFIYTTYYMWFKYKYSNNSSKIKHSIQNLTLNYQIKAALFTIVGFLFTVFIGLNIISVFMGMPMAQGEPDIEDGLSATEDIVAIMVGEIYSTLSYSLYLVNSLFIGMYYSDLRQINLVMSVESELKLNSNKGY